jgi:hypothetical protein
MASLDMDRLMDNAKVRLPGAVETAIQRELYEVMDEFFSDSLCWREDIPFTTVVNETDHDLFPTEGVINSLLYVVTDAGGRVGATMPDPGTVRLGTADATPRNLTATVSISVVMPLSKAGYPVFPDRFMQMYRAGILDGVLSRMMSQPAKPYTNLPLASFHEKRFQSIKARAKVDAEHQFTYGAQNWRFPQGFSSMRRR